MAAQSTNEHDAVVAPKASSASRAMWIELAGVTFAMTLLAVVHTWPLVPNFRTHLLGGMNEDPWMNAWHIDWVRRAILEWRNPFFAEVLHAPLGAELYWHTLVPAKSAWGVFLVPTFGTIASYNIVLFATFVLAGVTSYLFFADRLRGLGFADWSLRFGAFVGACVFDFSRYHLAHACAHMDLSSIEGLPLYLLCFCRYLESAKRRWLIGAALSIGYVSLCNFYYIYYLALFSLLWIAFRRWQTGPLFSLATWRSDDVKRGLRVGIAAGIACVPAVLPLLLHLHPEPLGIHHGDSDYPADPLLLITPDAMAALHYVLPDAIGLAARRMQYGILNNEEGGVFIGIAAPVLAYLGWRSRSPHALVFARIGLCFLVLSLGTHLHLGGEVMLPAQLALVAFTIYVFASTRFRGKRYSRDLKIVLVLACVVTIALPITAWTRPATMTVPLPYLFFKHMVPLFGRGGMPVRFLLLTQLCLAALAAIGAANMLVTARRNRIRVSSKRAALVAVLVAGIVAFETKNIPVPLEPVRPIGNAFDAMRADPEKGSVLTDHVIGQWEESIHRRPVSFARQSRLPLREIELHDGTLFRAITHFHGITDPWRAEEQAAFREQLRESNYRYFVGHLAAAVMAAPRLASTPDQLLAQRRDFVEQVLQGTLVFRDEEREVYRFW